MLILNQSHASSELKYLHQQTYDVGLQGRARKETEKRFESGIKTAIFQNICRGRVKVRKPFTSKTLAKVGKAEAGKEKIRWDSLLLRNRQKQRRKSTE